MKRTPSLLATYEKRRHMRSNEFYVYVGNGIFLCQRFGEWLEFEFDKKIWKKFIRSESSMKEVSDSWGCCPRKAAEKVGSYIVKFDPATKRSANLCVSIGGVR